MQCKEIKEIIQLMSSSNLESLEIETPEVTLRMKKNSKNETIIESKKDADLQEVVIENSNSSEKAPEIAGLKDKINDNIITIKSPIVGTFYSASSPDQDPFVQVGSKAKKGETLCIIEAMKLMNDIEADYDCEIVEVLVKNEDMLEYGQPIFNVIKL